MSVCMIYLLVENKCSGWHPVIKRSFYGTNKNRSFDGIPQSDFDCASCDSSARLRGSADNYVDNKLLLAEILDAEISIFVKTVFGLKTDVTARELAGVI